MGGLSTGVGKGWRAATPQTNKPEFSISKNFSEAKEMSTEQKNDTQSQKEDNLFHIFLNWSTGKILGGNKIFLILVQ